MSSVSPGEADLAPSASKWPAWVRFMVTTQFDLVSGPFGPKGALKGLVLARKGPFGALEVLGGPRGGRSGPNYT